jgi:hypothetical protein
VRTSKVMNTLIAGAALAAACPCIFGLNPNAKDALEQKLKEQYTLTKLTADRTGIVTAGAVLTLKKDGLILTPSSGIDVSGNSYKDGRITPGAVGRASQAADRLRTLFNRVPGIPNAPPAPAAPTNPTRKFVAGEKLNVTKIEAKDRAVEFEVYSVQAYSDIYYRGTLSFPYQGAVPSPDAMLATVGEVFGVDPTEDSRSGQAASQPAPGGGPLPVANAPPRPTQPTIPDQPSGKHYDDIPPPPPPPPDTPAPPKLDLNLTLDQVVALLGQPLSTSMDGEKRIYLFKGWKITFVKGKVADIDAR